MGQDTYRKILKVLVAVVLLLTMLTALVTHKLSLVWLLGNKTSSKHQLQAWYASVGLIVLVPEVYSLILVLWHTSFIKQTSTHQWPSGVSILVGLLTCFAEVASHMMFLIEVAPRLPTQILLPILASVYGIFLSHQQWYSFRVESEVHPEMAYDFNFTLAQKNNDIHDNGHHEHHLHTNGQNWKRVLRTIFGFSGMWSSCAIAGIVALTTPLPWFPALCLPACLCLLSLCWHPKVQVFSIRSSDGTFMGRWKATCVYTITKLLVSFIGLSLFMGVQFRQDTLFDYSFFEKLYNGLLLCKQEIFLIPLAMHFASCILCHMCGYLTTTLCIPTIGIGIPSLLATPGAVAYLIYVCFNQSNWFPFASCFTSGVGIWCACGLACITWVAPFIIHGVKICKKSPAILKPYQELFIQPIWNGLFLEQHLVLNYKHDGFAVLPETTEASNSSSTRKKQAKIYICTTMYREADFEMARLLLSLREVAHSDKLKDIYMETHIFLDHGTRDLHLTDFGCQLVSLLDDKLGICIKDANAYVTPYGVQLQWTLETGMPFYIHLKDPAKVKPKKRWSQVMYMSYVMNFRIHQNSQQEQYTQISEAKEHNIDPSIFVGYASDKEWNKNCVALNMSFDNTRSSSPPFMTCPPSRSQSIIKEHQARIRSRSRNSTYLETQLQMANTSMSSRDCETPANTSSDQGIGTGASDDVTSLSSASIKNEAMDSSSSENDEFPRGSSWQDYEGDVSSSNENSLTSFRQKSYSSKIIEVLRNDSITGISYTRGWRQTRLHPYKHHGQKRHAKPSCSKHQRCQQRDVEISHADTTKEIVEAMEDVSDDSVTQTSVPKKQVLDEDTYILATDADMEFTADSVLSLLDVCKLDRRLGGACGRTHPIGQKTGPLLWYQMFEYAKDFWMIKSAQNVIGSVMCCPGCFSLYRVGALKDVMHHYAGPTSQPFDVFIKDTGEDRWLCTLMMLRGWKLEYTAYCHNTTFCPSSLREFLTQRRRWVLSDVANMLLVLKYICNLARRNDSFSIAYILYLAQMFTIVLLSPASTMVILAGGLDIVYGLPFQIIAPLLGVMTLAYVLVCLLCSMRTQVKVTLVLTLTLGVSMLMVVIGGAVYVVQDMKMDWEDGLVSFQEYHLILVLIGALVFAAVIHPAEVLILCHGLSYLLGFPAMQILLPIYAACNIVDQSWGTRDENKSKSPPVSCFAKNRTKYHNSLSRRSKQTAEDKKSLHSNDLEDNQGQATGSSVSCTVDQYQPMSEGHQLEEYIFWQRMRDLITGHKVNQGLSGDALASGLRTLRNISLIFLLLLNILWIVLLSVLYFNADMNLPRVNIYGLIAAAVYGLVLLLQLIGMTIHRLQATFTKFALWIYGPDNKVWVYSRTS